MSKPTRIAVTSPSFSTHPTLAKTITEHFPGAKLNLTKTRYRGDALIDYLRDMDGAVIGLEQITDEVLQQLPDLKIISKYGVGLNNLDQDACERHRVKIGWTGGTNKLSVAELTLGNMLVLSRNIFRTANQLKQGIWNKNGGWQLSGKTVGIIGLGFIGKEVVRLLQPFHCRILVNDIQDQTDYYREHGLEEVDKETLMRESDFVTLHVPLDESTENLIDADALARMKPSAYLINSARGGIIDEVALRGALLGGVIAGAAIDAYVEEPPTDTDLLGIETLICTPHIGGNAVEAVEQMGRSAIRHLVDFFADGTEGKSPTRR